MTGYSNRDLHEAGIGPLAPAGRTPAYLARLEKAEKLARRILERRDQAPDIDLVRLIEREGPAEVSDRGPFWRCRCWGFTSTSTAGARDAVRNWCAHVLRRAAAPRNLDAP